MGKNSTDNAISLDKGASKSPDALASLINALCLEEKTLYPPLLLMFEIFNFNVHNCLVDSGASVNVMPLSVAKKMNAQWDKTYAQIIQLDRTCVPTIVNSRMLSSDGQVYQCINIVIVDIPKAYEVLLSKDWSIKICKDIFPQISHTYGFCTEVGIIRFR